MPFQFSQAGPESSITALRVTCCYQSSLPVASVYLAMQSLLRPLNYPRVNTLPTRKFSPLLVCQKYQYQSWPSLQELWPSYHISA